MMRKCALLLALSFIAVFTSAVYSQSLVDLANKEKERRQQIKDDKLITEDQVDKFKNPSEIVESSATDQSTTGQPGEKAEGEKTPEGAPAAAKGEKANSDEATDFNGRPESYWRQTMTEARQKVDYLEKEATALDLKLTDTQNQFNRAADGFRQQSIQDDFNKTLYEQSKNKEELAKAKDALSDLEKEAQKSGALPGWVGK
jgi:hypothetical protein